MTSKENKNIYIVEDMGITRAALISVLKRGGYNFVGCSAKAEKAWLELEKLDVAVVIIDINLEGAKDGIWLAKKIRKSLNCAIIFLTAYGSNTVLEKIRETVPDGYIMKPFNNPTLLYAIKTACHNLNEKYKKTSVEYELPIIIKSRTGKVKINKTNLIYLQSDGNYVNVHTSLSTYSVRGKLDEVISLLDYENLFRIHRRYAVNFEKVQSYNKNKIVVATNKELPFSKSFNYEELIKKIQRDIH